MNDIDNFPSSMPASPTVLVTDFGLEDPYVGIMKGVIHSICPGAQIIDLHHTVSQGDIQRGAITLHQSHEYFPVNTVFVVVIDPGVGTQRDIIILKEGGRYFVGPDNGVFSYILSDNSFYWKADNPNYYLTNISQTFHGRDIFAPIGAHLMNGVDPEEIGNPIDKIQKIPYPYLVINSPGEIRGEVLYSDRFGNLITSIGKFQPYGQSTWKFSPWLNKKNNETTVDLSDWLVILTDGQHLKFSKTFGDIPVDECGFIVGSTGLLEITSNNMSAQVKLGVSPGDQIVLRRL